ncbi:hypothetical protein C1645_811417, partial [Glomus cerebriforme]
FDSGNSESEKKHSALKTNVLTERFFSFVDSALKTNVLTKRFFSFVDSALESETETFAPRLGKPKRSGFGY